MARAAFLDGPRQVALRSLELPAAGDGELLVRVDACGICGTTLDAWRAPPDRLDSTGLWGHEVVGTVDGTLVCVDPNLAVACGRCRECGRGLPFLCTARRELATWGFAEAMVIQAAGAIAVPAGVAAEAATLTEPLACALHGLRQARAVAGGRVAIVGAGVLGLLTIVAARALGAEQVSAAARHPQQAAAARALGAVEALDGRPDVVVIAAGGPAPLLADALALVARGGDVVVLGLLDAPQALDARRAVLRETRVAFSISNGPDDFALALRTLAAHDLSALITHRFPLERIADALAAAEDKAAGALRVLVSRASR